MGKRKKPNIIQPPFPPKQVKSLITADAAIPTIDKGTLDSFVNLTAKLGIQADNLTSQGYYATGPFISRNRLELEAAYRSSWLVGRVVDCVAEDMTKSGVDFYSTMKPDEISELQVAMSTFGIWHDLSSAIKWSRLYGGCVAVMLIDGANYEKPLNIETIGKDKFKGLVVLDRWMLQPSMGDLITDLTKDIGKPKFYEVLAGISNFPSQRIHYSRVLRFEGIELPYYQKLFENLWGLSVVERMYDRLLAFDSATTGAAQLLYKAYLRVIGIEGFREALANGGRGESAVIKQFTYIRQMQNSEGITVLDAKDTFSTHTYSFSGISDLLTQFGQQISGAVEIPLVRLFGQSPSGFSTGDTDLRNYYDNVNKLQENQLRPQLDKLLAVMAKSEFGDALPEDFEFKFVSLWQMSETEKAAIASQDSATINTVHETGMISKATALKELRQQSRVTGRFTNITDEEIKDAENEIPPGMLIDPNDVGESAPPSKTEEPEDPNDRLGAQNPDELENTNEKTLKEEAGFKSKDAKLSLIKHLMDGYRKYRQQVMDTDFKESDHPRGQPGNAGQFGPGGGGKKASTTTATGSRPNEKTSGGESSGGKDKSRPTEPTKMDKDGKTRVTATGKPLPEYISKCKIPPAWTDVIYNANPKGGMLVKGRDAKGEWQYLYSDEHKAKKSESKFARVGELNQKYGEIVKQNMENLRAKKEEAVVLHLIMQTGIRPGDEDDHKAKVKAYGATTLEGRHVEVKGDKVLLHFIGKKGVELKIPVEDSNIAKTLIERKKKAGDSGQIFKTDSNKLLKYTDTLDGGGFLTKDFRTLLGTKTATELVKSSKQTPKDDKEYQKMIMGVAKVVSQKLGNTPAVALKSYIHPAVFQQWRSSIS